MGSLKVRLFLVLAMAAVLVGCGTSAKAVGSASPYDSVAALFALALNWIAGGGVAVILDDIPGWKDWSSPFKYWAALAITGVVGVALVSAQSFFTPELFVMLPLPLQALIGWLVVFISSQLAHAQDR